MSQLPERIEQFRKMAHDDPDNELGHFRLGQLLAEAGQTEEAIQSFRRTLELSPEFSKVFLLLATCLLKLNCRDEAAETAEKGYAVADQRGDNMVRDDLAKLLTQLGKPIPEIKHETASGPGTGFRCQRPGCMAGRYARKLTAPPMGDELGQRIFETVCADCWNDWLRNYSIKVINELRLDLSTDLGQAEYDRHMLGYLGLE
jgi:Fe-S cluster biosynthesis and repair protein YggX